MIMIDILVCFFVSELISICCDMLFFLSMADASSRCMLLWGFVYKILAGKTLLTSLLILRIVPMLLPYYESVFSMDNF